MKTSYLGKSSAKSKLFNSINYNKFDLSDEKRVKPDILSSYSKYIKFPFSSTIENKIKRFVNPFSILRNNSSSALLLSLKNLKEKKYFHIKRKTNIKKERNIKPPLKIKTFNNNQNNKENEENKFKSKYKNLIRNLSYNGNSKVYFKNLSNRILDDLFKNKPYNSFNTPKEIKISNFMKKILKSKYENILNDNYFPNKQTNKIKRQSYDIKYLNKDIFNKKNIIYNNKIKKINFENKILRNESSKDIFYENNNKTPLTSTRGKDQIKNKSIASLNDNSKGKKFERRNSQINFGVFYDLKKQLRKQNDVNSNLINNIKKEQSLHKYRLQVGIVKLIGYKPKHKKVNPLQF